MDKPPTTSRKRTRLVTGCSSCRERHLKCDSTLPKCRQCHLHGTICNRNVQLKFRYETSAGDSVNNEFPQNQTWMMPKVPLRYYDETPEIIRIYDDISLEESAFPGTFINTVNEDLEGSMSARSIIGDSDVLLPTTIDYSPVYSDTTRDVAVTQPGASLSRHHKGVSFIQPKIISKRLSSSFLQNAPPSRRANASSIIMTPASTPSTAPQSSPNERLPSCRVQIEPFTDREAELMQNFTENIALWVDATDFERHFEIEVAKQALSNTVLRCAIFSFSSRHLNRHAARPDIEEAFGYRNKAFQLLIPYMSGPMEGLTSVHLAAVIILRLDEEMDMDDTRSHLAGAAKMLNTMYSSSLDGALGEACAWLCLRQDIYIAIESRQALHINLGIFANSHWLQKDNDMAWANRMVLMLARILDFASKERSVERTLDLRFWADQVEQWNRKKPASFQPIRTIQRSKEKGKRLPVISMLSSFYVLGPQYYHMARIVLLLSLEQTSESHTGLEFYQHGKKIEKEIREHLLIILGLAVSNPRAENTMFQARHALAAWGWVLRHPLDQEAAIDFLTMMQNITGWDMSRVIGRLQESWHGDID